MADWISEAGGAVRQAHKENASIIGTVLKGIMITIALVIFLKFIKSFFPDKTAPQQTGLLGQPVSGGGLFGGGGGLLKNLASNPFINPVAIIPRLLGGGGGGGLFR